MEKKTLRVADVMQRDHAIVEGTATVAEALGVMREMNASCVIVAKRDDDDELAIVTTGDIAEHVLAPHRSPERVSVYEIMTKPAICVRPRMNIRYCARLFRRYGLAFAPVVEGDEIHGIVTYDQLVLQGMAEQP